MKILAACCYVENGELNYILDISTQEYTLTVDPELDGTQKTVHNNTVYPAAGGTGIPPMLETNFYTMYKA